MLRQLSQWQHGITQNPTSICKFFFYFFVDPIKTLNRLISKNVPASNTISQAKVAKISVLLVKSQNPLSTSIQSRAANCLSSLLLLLFLPFLLVFQCILAHCFSSALSKQLGLNGCCILGMWRAISSRLCSRRVC